jgi:hypothetical protein
VLQAARASLPPRPAWWQRLLGIEPGHAGMPRLWTAVAGVGAFGLALNLAWQLSKAPPPAEFDKVAAVSEAKRTVAPEPPIAPLQEKAAEAPAANTVRAAPAQQSALPAERQSMVVAQAPARRDAAPAPAVRSPSIVATTADAPAPSAPPAPGVAAAPAAQAEDKLLAKEERSNVGRLADAAPAKANDDGSADARARGTLAPAAVAPTGIAAAPSQTGPGAAATKPEALGRAKQAETSLAAAPSSAAWPPPLARFSSDLNGATDWPPGWQLQGPADVAVPRRAWWQAMLAGTAGRWQAWHQALPVSLESAPTWRLHGPDGAGFSLTLGEDQAWLQAGGAIWRAPWTVAPPR